MRYAAVLPLLWCGFACADSDDEVGRRLQALLHAHQGDVFTCVEKEPEFAVGEALLRIVVGGGHVPEVLKSDAAVARAAECVARAARTWDVSPLGASAGDQIVFPLAFTAERPGADNVALAATMRKERVAAGRRLELPADRETVLVPVKGRLADLDAGTLSYSAGTALAFVAKGPAVVLRIEAPHHGEPVRRILPLGSHATRMLVEGIAFDLRELCLPRAVRLATSALDVDTFFYIERGRATVTLDRNRVESRAGDVVTIPRGTAFELSVRADMCVLEVKTHVRPVTSAPASR